MKKKKKKKIGKSPERVSVGEEGEAIARREAEDGKGAETDRGMSGVSNLGDEHQCRKPIERRMGFTGKVSSSSSSSTIHVSRCCSGLVLLMHEERGG